MLDTPPKFSKIENRNSIKLEKPVSNFAFKNPTGPNLMKGVNDNSPGKSAILARQSISKNIRTSNSGELKIQMQPNNCLVVNKGGIINFK